MTISGDSLALCYGLSCALVWGTGDFAGGIASKRTNAFVVVFFSQLASLAPLGLLILWRHEPLPNPGQFAAGAIAGIFGAMGLIAFYTALACGRMGLVAPLTAVLTALLPLVYASVHNGLPYPTQLLGFLAAGTAIWLLAAPRRRQATLNRREAVLTLAAGSGFGLFFLFIHHAGADSVLWPLASARLASLPLLGIGLLTSGRLQSPPLPRLPLIAATGLLDMLGNALFILAAQAGRLDVSVIVSSLAPGGTVLLAWIFLQERLSVQQWAGVLSALVAIGLIAA